jgi:hypothetical protein
MALRVHEAETENRGPARRAPNRLFQAPGRRRIVAGALLAVAAVLLLMVGLGSFSSGRVRVPVVAKATHVPATPIQVPAQDQLVSVDRVLIDPPTASGAELTGVGTKAKLSFTLTAGKGAAAIETLIVTLPRGMTFSRSKQQLARWIAVEASGRPLRLTSKVSDGKLAIRLHVPAHRVQVTIVRPAIKTSTALAHKIKMRRVTTLQIPVTAIDMRHDATHITLSLGATQNTRLRAAPARKR